MRNEKFYNIRLSNYFDAHYGKYEGIAEWYVNPAPNQWKFEIPRIGVVVLICSDDGKITETIKETEPQGNRL